MTKRITRKTQKHLNTQGVLKNSKINTDVFNIDPNIRPITDAQSEALDAWNENYNLVLHGSAGTGKTFLGLYLALTSVLKDVDKDLSIDIIRSAVPSREVGFLQGSLSQKTKEYFTIYEPLINKILNNQEGIKILTTLGRLRFHTTSFLRGREFNNSIVIVDEMQNCNYQELRTIITRMGKGSRLIYCGDTKQTDLKKKGDESGYGKLMEVLKNVRSFDFVEFFEEDIVRSGLVKEFIIEENKLGY